MSEKSKSTAFLLCYFLGVFGVHRFYLNRVKTGLLMLVTLGGLGIWWMVDSVLIAAGQLTDGNGDRLRTGPPDPDNPAAGFWVRLAAFSVDGLILNIILSVVFMGLSIVLPLVGMGAMGAMEGDLGSLGDEQQAMMGMVFAAVIGLLVLAALPLYFGIQHASRHQATIGKRCFDIHVTTGDGARIGLGRSVWRALGYVISALPLYLGFVMAAFTRDKRALHDYLAGTRVRHLAGGEPLAEVSHDSVTEPNFTSPTPQAPARAVRRAGTVEKSGDTGTGLMILGAVLLAGAAAAALLM